MFREADSIFVVFSSDEKEMFWLVWKTFAVWPYTPGQYNLVSKWAMTYSERASLQLALYILTLIVITEFPFLLKNSTWLPSQELHDKIPLINCANISVTTAWCTQYLFQKDDV